MFHHQMKQIEIIMELWKNTQTPLNEILINFDLKLKLHSSIDAYSNSKTTKISHSKQWSSSLQKGRAHLSTIKICHLMRWAMLKIENKIKPFRGIMAQQMLVCK